MRVAPEKWESNGIKSEKYVWSIKKYAIDLSFVFFKLEMFFFKSLNTNF